VIFSRGGKASGIIVRLLVGAVVVVALFFFARSVQWGEVWRAMRASSLSILVAAAAVNLLSVALKGVRWWVFMRPVGITSLWLAVRGTFVGAGLNNILVANGGEAARVVYVSREANAPASTVLATLALERLFELIGWAFTLCIAVSVLDLPDALTAARPAAVVGLVVMTAILLWLLRAPSAETGAEVAGEHFVARMRRFGRQFMRSLREVASGPRFLGALVISIVVWALQIATYHLTAVAAGLPISVVATIACLLTVNLGFAVRATPGNVGVFQMVYAVTAAGFGADKELATGTAFLIQIQQILPVTLLGLGFAPGLLRARGNPMA
jgi:uncharacterized protein (TIRG00374 family)